ncbi:type II toxin-antitoxin system prevent-host-death family antitoxin [Tetragenococcus halophilus]|uniref:Antitoxin n=2 Tax=Tetragenococcus halophilus TaxID=51669 RepID=A0A2H6CTG6_TETHA|nr:type II toxin-antitoxin system prevent-host-death family antitoxin [Tetragenococcus halophilus]MDN6519043.1 type II toxin-antitoxin system prevent-host-death family antitoxin [Enterococcus sp.]MCF1601444.1 type II toxin-antitoxin system prevent-host-death family antitoxin [Tetragenococcus halophilus]MCF1675413.1 type II toxin-antitoxin system prevent-host-death family antitoxin [Tetragenococcus halophilus]MCF1685138.1 type II toxin-antitoxin system prevent-host-death family antitoxin [Tetrag
MNNVIPISDLISYNQILSKVQEGNPIILTKNGSAKYVVTDFTEWQEMKETIDLFSELQKGAHSHKEESTLSLDQLKSHVKDSLDEE